jgi:hypothetical protein
MPNQTHHFSNSAKILSNFGRQILEKNDERKKHIKTLTKFIYLAFAAVILAIGALTADGGPGDLIAPQYHGHVFQVPINPPFGTPSFYWDNSNLPLHAWAGCAFDRAGNLYLLEQPGCVNCNNIYKLSPDRTTLSLFASGIGGGELLVDAAGNVYEAEEDANTCTISVYRFDPQTAVRSTFATINGTPDCAGSGGFGSMAFDSQGNLFIASGQYTVPNQLPIVKIFKITPQAQVSEFIDIGNGYQAGDIAFDSVGNLFVLAVNSYSIPIQRRLFVYTPNGFGPGIFGGIHDNVECSVGNRFGNHMVIDSANNIYLSSVAATITQYPPTYACGDPVPSIYVGNGYDPYETLGQLVIQPPAYAAQVQPPINADGTSIFNAHRGVVSVRFALTYGGAATCTLPSATIAVTRTAGGVTGNVNESVYTASADTGSNFRINGCQYMYNLDARALGVGIYRLDIKIYGGAIGSATFELR